MGRKAAKPAEPRLEEIKQRIMQRVGELFDEHAGEFMQVLEESETKKVTVGFPTELDFSDSVAKVKTRIRFSQSVTDERIDDFADPNAPALPGIDMDAVKEQPKRRKRGQVTDEFPETMTEGAAPEGNTSESNGEPQLDVPTDSAELEGRAADKPKKKKKGAKKKK